MTILLLDIDGVLITTPTWKADSLHSDGYSDFNKTCVENLNVLLTKGDFEIWLTSTRRTTKTIDEFNQIFRNRGINSSIKGFVPSYTDSRTRKDEILSFLLENKTSNFLILDDDKSLNGLENHFKERLISTELTKGFNADKLNEAIKKIKNGS